MLLTNLAVINLIMAPNRSDQGLSVDFDALCNLMNEATESARELQEQCKKVVDNVEELKSTWKTPAGEKFFNNLDNDWTDGVNKYCLTMETFVEAVKNLTDTMETVLDEYQNTVYLSERHDIYFHNTATAIPIYRNISGTSNLAN